MAFASFQSRFIVNCIAIFFLSLFLSVQSPHDAKAVISDECAGLIQTGILCRLVSVPTVEGVLPVRSNGAISAFVAAKIKQANLTSGAVELGLFTLLPGEVQKRCTEGAGTASSDKLGVALLCLRPVCLHNSPPETCRPILQAISSAKNLGVLQAIVANYAKSCGPNDACNISPEAVELVLAADQLRQFLIGEISNSWSEICPENASEYIATCTRRIAKLAEQISQQYALSSAWHYAISQIRTSDKVSLGKSIIERLPEVDQFEKAWAEVAPLAEKGKDANSSALFALTPALADALAKCAAATVSMVRALKSAVDDERFDVAQKQLDGLRNFFKTEIPGSADFTKLKDALPKAISRDDPRWREIAKSIRGLVAQVDRLQLAVLKQSEKALLPSEAKLCPDGQQGRARFDSNAGTIEYCYPDAKVVSGLKVSGLRFKYAPCGAPASQCSTEGDLQILWRFKDGPVIAQSLGLEEIHSNVVFDPGGNTPRVLLRNSAPSFAFRQKDSVLASAISQVFPSPLAVRVISADVSSGPQTKLVLSVGINVPGLTDVTQMSVKLTQDGVFLEDGSRLDDILAFAQEKLLATLAGRKVQFGGWNLDLVRGERKAGCTGAVSFEMTARASVVAVSSKADVVFVACDSKLSVRIADISKELERELSSIVNENLGRISKDLKLASDIKFSIRDEQVHALLGIAFGKCSAPIDLNLSKKVELAADVRDLTRCALSEAAAGAIAFAIDGIGFKATSQPGVYCSETIPTIGRFCLSGVAPPFTSPSGTLQSDGDALKGIGEKLPPVIRDNAVVRSIGLESGHIVVTADVTLPGVGPLRDLKFQISSSGISAVSLGAALRAAASEKLKGKSLNIAGIELGNIEITKADEKELGIAGTVSYGGFSGKVEVDILPSLKVKPIPPRPEDIGIAVLKQVLGPISAVKNIELVNSSDGVPALQVEVEVTVPIFDKSDFKAGAVVEAKAGGKLKFAGPVSITLPIPWIEVWWIAIGRIRSRLDLNKPLNDISIGASLTIIPGEGSYDVIGIDGDLHIRPKSVQLDSTLSIISIPLGQTTGEWRYSEGMLEVNIGTTNLPDIIPLPSGHLVIDGQACAIAGSASAKLLGAKIASAGAGLLIGSSVCTVGPPRDPVVANLNQRCGARGPIGSICILGDVAFGGINGKGIFSSRIDQIMPTITGDIDVAKLATFSVRVNSSLVRLSTSVLGFRLAVVLPNVEGLNEEFLRRLIENLLKPSIDLNALLRGDIKISPASKSGHGDDAMVDGKDDGSSPPGNPSDGPKKENGGNKSDPAKPNTPAPPVAKLPGGYLGPPGPVKLEIRQYKSSEFWEVIENFGGRQYPMFPHLFSRNDADDLRTGRSVIFNYSPLQLPDGGDALLACKGWPCKSDGVVAIRAYPQAESGVSPSNAAVISISNGLQAVDAKDANFTRVSPQPDGTFAFPSLIRFLANRSLVHDVSPAAIMCAQSAANKECELDLLRTPSGLVLAWKYFSEGSLVPDTSFARLILDQSCQATCDENKVAGLLNFNGGFYSLNLRKAPVVGLRHSVKLDSSSKQVKTEDFIDQLGPNDAVPAKSWPVAVSMPDQGWFRPFDPIVSHPLLEDLLSEMASKIGDSAKVRLWMLSDEFVSALVEDGGAATVWSGLKQNGKSCLRSQGLAAVMSKISVWSQQGFVEPAYGQVLSKQEGREDLMRSLADPLPRRGQFSRNPLLLLGDPAASCK